MNDLETIRFLARPPGVIPELPQILDVRREAWAAEGLYATGAGSLAFFDGVLDPQSWHFLALTCEEVIGCARVTPVKSTELLSTEESEIHATDLMPGFDAYWSRMAVKPEVQDKGIARKLDQKRLEWCHEQEATRCWVSASLNSNRHRSLESLGFEAIRHFVGNFTRLNGELWKRNGVQLMRRR